MASPSSLFQAANSRVKASGLWSAGPVGSAMLGLLALASAILELTVALRCCCGVVVGSGSQNPKAVGGSVFFSFQREGATRKGRWGFWCFGEGSSICGAMVVAEELVSGEVRELWPGVFGRLKKEEEGEAAVGRDSRERERSMENGGKIGRGLWFWERGFSVFDKGREWRLAFKKDESFGLLGFSFFLYYSLKIFSSPFFSL